MEKKPLQVKEALEDTPPERRVQDLVERDLRRVEQLLEVVHMALRLPRPDQTVPRPLPDRLGGAPYPSLEHREPHQLEKVACLFRVQRKDLFQVLSVRRRPHREPVPLVFRFQPEVVHQESESRQGSLRRV